MASPIPDTTTKDADSPAPTIEPWLEFARGLVDWLGLELVSGGGGWSVLEAGADDDPPTEPGSSGIWRALRRREAPAPEPEALLSKASPGDLVRWLADRLAEEQRLPCFEPADEPHAVHEIVAPMFDSYQVDGGAIHLGGCHVELTPLLRLTMFGANANANTDAPDLSHRFFTPDGRPMDDKLVDALGLEQLAGKQKSRSRFDRGSYADLIQQASGSLGGDQAQPIATIVVAKRVEGNLQATIGDESLAIGFGGWSSLLTAPPAVCPATGAETFHLTSLGDGRIVAAEQTVDCQSTGEKILEVDSVVCSGTGKRVAGGLCSPCPVTGEPTLPEAIAPCPRCGARVSRAALSARGCRGCDAMEKVAADDDRLAPVLAAAPKLAARKAWRLADCDAVLIAETRSWTDRTILVVDKATGQVQSAAHSRLWPATWRPLPLEELSESA